MPISYLATKLQASNYQRVADFMGDDRIPPEKREALKVLIERLYTPEEIFRATNNPEAKREVIEKLLDINFSGKTVEEVIQGFDQEEAKEEQKLEAKALNAKELEILLREFDDAKAQSNKKDEAIAELLEKYKISDSPAKRAVRQAIERKLQIQRELEVWLVKEGKNLSEARELADIASDEAVLTGARLEREVAGVSPEQVSEIEEKVAKELVKTGGTTREKIERIEEIVTLVASGQIEAEVVKRVASDAVAETVIREEYGENQKAARVVIETEKILRPLLGEKGLDITLAGVVEANKEEAVKQIGQPAVRAKVERELEFAQAVIRQIETNREMAETLANQTAAILQIETQPEKVEALKKVWEERIEARIEGNTTRLGEDILVGETGAGSVERFKPGKETISWPQQVQEITIVPINDQQIGSLSKVLRDGEEKLKLTLNGLPPEISAWKNNRVRERAETVLALANPTTSEERISQGARLIAEISQPRAYRKEEENRFWISLNQLNEAGEINPRQVAEIGAIYNMIRSPVTIGQQLAEINKSTEGLVWENSNDPNVEAVGNIKNILNQNPEMVKFMENARLRAAMAHGVQAWMGQRIAGLGAKMGILSLQNFGLRLSSSAGFSLDLAKGAAGILKTSGLGVESMKGILGLIGGKGAGGMAAGIATKLGLGATGVGLVVVGAQIGGALLGKLLSPITDFIRDKTGIDLGGITKLGGNVLGGLGLKAALPGIVAKAGAALPAVGSALAGFGASVMGAIGAAGATLFGGPLLLVVVVVVVIGIPLIMILTTNNQAATMVPPGRGVGGPVFDQSTIAGGFLAPPLTLNPDQLVESCPDLGVFSGWRVTQGPNAAGCSHAGYENTVDYGIGMETPIPAAHDGTVVTMVASSTGYGNYIDVAAKCNGVGYVTRYAHLSGSTFSMVNMGQSVNRGQIVANSDHTGNSTGPHLHFEIRGLTTSYVDPKYYGCCLNCPQ